MAISERDKEMSERHFRGKTSYGQLAKDYGLHGSNVRQRVERVQRVAVAKASKIHREAGEDAFIRELYRINYEVGLHPRYRVWLREYEAARS